MSANYALYYYDACPFCQRVLRFLQESGIELEMRHTLRDPEARAELLRGGGRGMVPCLRIRENGEEHWLYESADIIAYLKQHHPGRIQ